MQPFTFPGYRVGLRPIRLDDVDAVLGWINDPDVTRNFARMSEPISREEELAFLERMIASDTDRLCAVVDRGGACIGSAGIHRIYWPARNGRLGLVLHRDAQGQGLGREVLRLLCALGFRELGLHKLWLVHYATNARMQHLAATLGFVPEGLLRDEYHHRGVFHDMLRHAILEDEFEALAEAWGMLTG